MRVEEKVDNVKMVVTLSRPTCAKGLVDQLTVVPQILQASGTGLVWRLTSVTTRHGGMERRPFSAPRPDVMPR